MSPADSVVPPRASAEIPSLRGGGPEGSSGSKDAFVEFRRRVIEEPALHAALVGFDDVEQFAARAVALGAERGLVFGTEDVRVALQAARRAWIERHIV